MKNIFFAILVIVSCSGCRPEKPIEVSTYEKLDDLMLVGISIRGQSAWTLKVVGSRAEILKIEDTVIEFAKSFDFSADPSRPKWDVPAAWTKLDITRLGRIATFSIPTSKEKKELELVVSQLGIPPKTKNTDEYIADNINRWRKQMGLQEVIHYTVDQNNREIGLRVSDLILPFMKQVDVGGRTMYFEKIEGKKPESAGPPFMSGMQMPHGGGMGSATKSKPSPDPPKIPKLPFEFTAPENWKPLEPNSVAVLRYEAGTEADSCVVAVSSFPSSSVNWNETVTMWQGQLKLEKSDDMELEKITESIDLESGKAKLVKLSGGETSDGKSITGVVLNNEKDLWFVKMLGKSEIVEREFSNFESFVKSIKFRSGGGN